MQKIVNSTVYILISVLSAVLLIGCPGGAPQNTAPTPPLDTTPPARSVSVNGLVSADGAISFVLKNPNAEAAQVAITLTPRPPDDTMIEFDDELIPFSTAVRIPLAATDDGDAIKQIRISALENGTEYILITTTLDTNGNRRIDTTGDTVTPARALTAPAIPANLIAFAGNREITLNWDNVAGADQYYIYRAIDGDPAERLPATPAISVAAHTDIGLTNGVRYTYTIRAMNGVGMSEASEIASATAADDHGDSIETATPVVSGSHTAGRLDAGRDVDSLPGSWTSFIDDVDYFSIEVTAGETIRALTTGGLDTVGGVLDSDGTELASDDHSGIFPNFRAFYTAPTTATYFIRVAKRLNRQSYAGDYTLIVSVTPSTTTDDHGDTIANATAVTNGSMTAGRVETEYDTDYFSITVPAGHTLSANTTGSLSTIGTVFSASGTYIGTTAGTYIGTTADNNFSLSYRVSRAGTYFVSVRNWGARNVRTPDTGDYTFHISLSPSDDHGDTIATATEVTSGSATPGILNYRRDADYFSITIPAGQMLRAYTTGTLKTVGRILSSSGEQLAIDATGGTHNNFYLTHLAATTDTYFIEVTSEFGRSAGAYTLMVSVVSAVVDDHGDTIATATAVTNGSSTAGMIDPDFDTDYFSITVPAGQTLRAYTTGDLDTVGVIFDSASTTLASDDNSGTGSISRRNFDVSYRVTTPGTYIIRVSGALTDRVVPSTSKGAYTLIVSFAPTPPTPLDSHGNTIATATAVVSGSSVAGQIDPAIDVDNFSVVVPAGQTLSAYTTGGLDTVGVVFSSDGRIVARNDDVDKNRNFRISYTPTVSGTYTIRVGSFDSASTGEYRLVVSVR